MQLSHPTTHKINLLQSDIPHSPYPWGEFPKSLQKLPVFHTQPLYKLGKTGAYGRKSLL